jgi:Ca2+-binding EF-hand superfamily protein
MSSTLKKQTKLPALAKISSQEAQAVASMFRLYDYKARGKIPKHLARNLVQSLGFTQSYVS